MAFLVVRRHGRKRHHYIETRKRVGRKVRAVVLEYLGERPSKERIKQALARYPPLTQKGHLTPWKRAQIARRASEARAAKRLYCLECGLSLPPKKRRWHDCERVRRESDACRDIETEEIRLPFIRPKPR